MQVTPASLNVLFTTVRTDFWRAYTLEELMYQKLCTTYPAASEVVLMSWLQMTAKLREWVGPRMVQTPSPMTYQVPIKLFEQTENIDRYKIEDDLYSVYYPVVANMGKQAAKYPDYQLRDLLLNQNSWTGGFQTGTDGVSHWNTAHPVDFFDSSKGTYPNDYTSGGQTVNTVLVGGGLSVNAYATVWEDMSRRKSESGESQEVVGNLVVSGPMLAITAKTVLEASFFGAPVIGNLGTQATPGGFPAGVAANPNQYMVGATENMFRNNSDYMMWRDLSSSTSIGGGTYDQVWYTLDTTKAVKPFSFFLRMAPKFAFLIEPTNPLVFSTHSFTYGVEARGSVGWAPPFLSSRSGP